jgi:hypothetical protein
MSGRLVGEWQQAIESSVIKDNQMQHSRRLYRDRTRPDAELCTEVRQPDGLSQNANTLTAM